MTRMIRILGACGICSQRLLIRLALLILMMPALPSFACSVAQPETFEPFLARFVRDAEFARQRTTPLVQTIKWDHVPNAAGDNADWVSQETPVPAATFFTDFGSLSTLMNDPEVHSTVKVIAPHQRSVFLGMPESDALLLTYKFEQRKGCWYLSGFEDESL